MKRWDAMISRVPMKYDFVDIWSNMLVREDLKMDLSLFTRDPAGNNLKKA